MRALLFTAWGLCLGLMLSAQTPQLPSFHGGNPNRTLDIKQPENATLRPVLEYDFSRNNPNFRSAQPRVRSCATEEMEADRQAKYANETETTEQFEQFIEQSIQKMQQTRSLRRMTRGAGVYSLPTVVHVIYSNPIENISEEQVLSQIRVLNQDYRRQNADRINTPREFKRLAVDTEIEFCLATVDPEGNATNGIDRISMGGAPFKERYINEVIKPSTIWNPDQYFNIWVINVAGGILGFAQFPSSSGLTGLPAANGTRMTDGVVINFNVFGTTGTVAPPFDRGRTTTHEIGHWMGLRHVWGDGPCGVDDFCDDTPETNGAHYSCPPSVLGCSGDRAMIQNFMDYTDDACMNLFTLDQKMRMRAVLENSPRRKNLLNSTACEAVAEAPKPAFASDISIGCAPLSVSFTNQSEGEQLSFAWSFPGGKPATSNDPNPKVTYRKPGSYTVSLRVSNPGGTRTTEQTAMVQVIDVGLPIPIKLDFEQIPPFPPLGFQLYNPHQDHSWAHTPRVSANGQGSGAMVINNYDNNFKGSDDWLVSPILDLSDGKGTVLAFDVAYAPFDGKYSDTLGLFISTGCETTYRNIYYKGGEKLATAEAYNRPFLPRADEWRRELIDLRAYYGEHYVHIAMVGFSGHGNDLFLDNVEVYSVGEAAPQAGFKAAAQTICAGNDVQFKDQSLNQPSRWVWSFPGGTPASDTIPNPTVTYEKPGVYDVILTVYNEGGEDTRTLSKHITVNNGPGLNLATSSTKICAGESITLQAESEGSLRWDLGTEAPVLNQRKISLKPKQDATYTAIATGTNGCSIQKSVTVRVEPGRKLTLTPPSATICAGSEVTVQATGADAYFWEPDEGLSNVKGSLVRAAPERTTTYIVTGTTRSGCIFKGEVTIEVQAAPVDFDIVVTRDEICPGEQTEMQARGAAAFSWAPAKGLNRTEGDVVIAAPERTTTYRVSAITENGCTAEKPIT
ncbi:MAG: PKD domain-containing protein, partial [Bacteroidota bacterium]